jgi:hypothetical protein
MQQATMNELKNRLRNTFHDEYKIQWSEELLDEILYEAQREYVFYSGGLTGKHKVFTATAPVLNMPEDFYQVISVISPDGQDIPIVSYKKLVEDYGDFRSARGDKAKFCCFDFDTQGKFRLYPQLPAGAFAGTVTYKRFPAANEWAAKNSRAIELYAMFLMFQFTGKAQAQNCFNMFIGEIYLEQQQKLEAGRKNIVRTGVYF